MYMYISAGIMTLCYMRLNTNSQKVLPFVDSAESDGFVVDRYEPAQIAWVVGKSSTVHINGAAKMVHLPVPKRRPVNKDATQPISPSPNSNTEASSLYNTPNDWGIPRHRK